MSKPTNRVPDHAPRDSGGGLVRLRGLVPALAVMLTALPAKAVDLDRMTVVTLGRDGSWGVATAGSQGQAIAAALGDCRAMAGARSDCGAHFTTTRGGWVIAKLCGDHKIMVTAETRDGAEQAALAREANMKRLYRPDLPSCRHVLTVDPSGAAAPSQAARPPQVDARGRER